jgi:hypothetical protein
MKTLAVIFLLLFNTFIYSNNFNNINTYEHVKIKSIDKLNKKGIYVYYNHAFQFLYISFKDDVYKEIYVISKDSDRCFKYTGDYSYTLKMLNEPEGEYYIIIKIKDVLYKTKFNNNW